MTYEDPQRASEDLVIGDPLLGQPTEFEPPIAAAPELDAPAPLPTEDEVGVDSRPVATIPAAEVDATPGNRSQRVDDEPESGSKVKAAAVLAGAAALANKVRQKAPEVLQDIRDKRAVGKCVVIVERGGVRVAIGPFKDQAEADESASKLAGTANVIPLMTEDAFNKVG